MYVTFLTQHIVPSSLYYYYSTAFELFRNAILLKYTYHGISAFQALNFQNDI